MINFFWKIIINNYNSSIFWWEKLFQFSNAKYFKKYIIVLKEDKDNALSIFLYIKRIKIKRTIFKSINSVIVEN